MNGLLRQAQGEFVNHPVTQTALNTMAFVATGGVDGLIAASSAVSSLLVRQGAKQAPKIVGNLQSTDLIK